MERGHHLWDGLTVHVLVGMNLLVCFVGLHHFTSIVCPQSTVVEATFFSCQISDFNDQIVIVGVLGFSFRATPTCV